MQEEKHQGKEEVSRRRKWVFLGGVSKYHNNVEEGIKAFGAKRKRFVKVLSDNMPIAINHPKRRMLPILYKPDVRFITKTGKQYIFEILDSEIKDFNLIIADIIQACLSPNTSDVIFIVPEEDDEDTVLNLAQTITDNLMCRGVPKRDIPTFHAYFILTNEAEDAETVAKILDELL
jgi:hypothetical protein